jgi:hypothetical protein
LFLRLVFSGAASSVVLDNRRRFPCSSALKTVVTIVIVVWSESVHLVLFVILILFVVLFLLGSSLLCCSRLVCSFLLSDSQILRMSFIVK